MEHKTTCTKCSGSGWTPVYKNGINGVEPCVCRTVELRLRAVGFGGEHIRWTLADYGKKFETAGLEIVQQVSMGGALIFGQPGSGKTSYAAALCRAAINLSPLIAIRFYMARELLRRIRDTYDAPPGAERETEVVADLTTVPILVIDDLGQEGNVKDAGVGVLHEVLSKRDMNSLLTIVTTNLLLTPDPSNAANANIESVYNPSIASRMGGKMWKRITMAGEDRRKRK